MDLDGRSAIRKHKSKTSAKKFGESRLGGLDHRGLKGNEQQNEFIKLTTTEGLGEKNWHCI